ncbi:MAG: hypothetical protein V7K88_22755 [Nostoc sp.]|uniref:hypothetical protein n=1 Tax=Nostoc sp. TaxID=1180 RepID=UPI002FF470D9
MKQVTNYVVWNFLSFGHHSAKSLSSQFFSGIFSINGEDIRSVEAGMCASQPNPLNTPIYKGIISMLPAKRGSFGEVEKV